MNSFLKIIDFDSFREFCKNRNGILCTARALEGYLDACPRANKDTMQRCPIWKLFKDFNVRSIDGKRDEKRKSFRDSETFFEESEAYFEN